jgi:hypothetical protein
MKLHSGYETEFYVSDAGFLVIKQSGMESLVYSEIILTPEQARVLFNLSTELMDQQKAAWTGIVYDDL